MKINRRQWAAIVAGSGASAQTPPPSAAPQTPAAELDAARAQLRANLDQLAKVKVPMAVEPAFTFKA